MLNILIKYLSVRKRTIYIFLKVEFIHNKRLANSKSGIDGLLVGGALMNCNELEHFIPSLKLKR